MDASNNCGKSKEIDFKLDLGRGAELFGLQTIGTDRSRFAQIITNVNTIFAPPTISSPTHTNHRRQLMSNAIRFTDMSTDLREIKVSLELTLEPPSDDTCAPPPLMPGRMSVLGSPMSESGADASAYIYVSVQDSGPGLQKEDLALLFQR